LNIDIRIRIRVTTKERILDASLELFNACGFARVTIRDIAAAVNISTGNLAYHFKNKDFIVEALFTRMEAERDKLLSEAQAVPSFENIHEQFYKLLQLSDKYSFFYIDTVDIMRTYPKLAELQRLHINKDIEYLKAMIAYSVGIGNLRQEPEPGYYDRLAHGIWMGIFFWLQQAQIRDLEPEPETARRTMWSMVMPHLTEEGLRHFQNKVLIASA